MYLRITLLIITIFLFFSAGKHGGLALADSTKQPAPQKISYQKPVLPGPVPAKILNIIDGDTIRAEVMIWPGQYVKTYIRINGIDTPERKGRCAKEKTRAAQATKLLQKTIPETQHILLYNIHNGKYAGRVVADIKTTNGVNIAETMLASGLARPYDGKTKRQPWCGVNDT